MIQHHVVGTGSTILVLGLLEKLSLQYEQLSNFYDDDTMLRVKCEITRNPKNLFVRETRF